MKIILLGPPGAGKGTQAEMLAKKLFLPHISTGDMFRAAISAGTELGLQAKLYMDQGRLVPDEVTIGTIKDRIAQPDCREGFLLDGFPRTLPQAEALSQLLGDQELKIDAVINITVPDETLVERLSGRRICRQCGAIYHLLYSPPEQDGICDTCGGELYQRDDDTEDTVRSRLAVYHSRTAPLIDYYRAQGVLHDINGDQPIKDVLLEIGTALGQKWS